MVKNFLRVLECTPVPGFMIEYGGLRSWYGSSYGEYGGYGARLRYGPYVYFRDKFKMISCQAWNFRDKLEMIFE